MPKVPKGLTGTARELFKRIASPFVLDEQPVALLTDAGLLRQRAEQARQQIDVAGIGISDDKGRPMHNPPCVVERQSLALSARLLTPLDLGEA
jgi:hypothetical protein